MLRAANQRKLILLSTIRLKNEMHDAVYFFGVCVEVLQPSQPNGVISSVVNLPNHIFTGQALSSKRLTSIAQILIFQR